MINENLAQSVFKLGDVNSLRSDVDQQKNPANTTGSFFSDFIYVKYIRGLTGVNVNLKLKGEC